MQSYMVEFRDKDGQPGNYHGRSEVDQLAKGRAIEIAQWWCRQHPNAMAFVHLEVQKPYHKKTPEGHRRFATTTEIVLEVHGHDYKKDGARSTMERSGGYQVGVPHKMVV